MSDDPDPTLFDGSDGADTQNGSRRNGHPQRRAADRIGVLRATKTPLGFYSLVLLIAEAIWVVVYFGTPEEAKLWVLAGMLLLLLLLTVVVAVVSWFRPEALAGNRPIRSVAHWRRRLKPGDTVQVITPPRTVVTAEGVIEWKNKEMGRYAGKRAQVVAVEAERKLPRVVKLDIDAQNYDWAPEWLEPAE